jgi:8-oxo-dGTP diphosphatase
MSEVVHVAVAVIINDDNEVCISLRHRDAHQGGLWEFPGGKIEQHETVEQALVREIREELNLIIETSRPLITVNHNYHDKNVCLHVRQVLRYHGQAKGVEGQQVRWLPVGELSSDDFPAANLSIIKAVQLPDKYLITGKFVDEADFVKKLTAALDGGIKLVQLRLKGGDLSTEQVPALVRQVSSLCVRADAKLLFNMPQAYLKSIDLSAIRFDGFHADSKTLNALAQRPAGCLFSASCHNRDELLKAEQLGADFVVLSPVQKTASHPEMAAMGWSKFSSLLAVCAMPVYALGGVSADDIAEAWSNGAQGVAAISAFWR